MNERVNHFLASARSLALSPLERAEARASIVAQMVEVREARAILEGSADAFRLTDYEKAIGRSRLLGFMDAHPVRTPRAPLLDMLLRRFAPAALASVFSLTVIGGGFAYAAEDALPGDLLYPVKTRITEPLILRFAPTTAKRAEWDVRFIERRLKEASALERYAPERERQAVLRSQMEKNVGNLEKCLPTLPAEEQRIVRDTLVSELTQHQQSLLQMHSSTGVPHALKALVEDAARDDQEAAVASGEPSPASSPSSSALQNDQQKKNRQGGVIRFAVPPDTGGQGEGEETRREEGDAASAAASKARKAPSLEVKGGGDDARDSSSQNGQGNRLSGQGAAKDNRRPDERDTYENEEENSPRSKQETDARRLLRLLEEAPTIPRDIRLLEQSDNGDRQPADLGQEASPESLLKL